MSTAWHERRAHAVSEVRQVLQNKMIEWQLGSSWEDRAEFLAMIVALEEIQGTQFLWDRGEEGRTYTKEGLLASLRASFGSKLMALREFIDNREGEA